MSAGLDEVRSAIAARHGLTESATGFLVGSNVAELEASAGALSRLLSEREHSQPEPEPFDIFAAGRAAKIERQRAIVAMASGRRAPQPRDPSGRFGSFDGGARRTVVARPADPAKDHAETVLKLARARALGDTGFLAQ